MHTSTNYLELITVMFYFNQGHFNAWVTLIAKPIKSLPKVDHETMFKKLLKWNYFKIVYQVIFPNFSQHTFLCLCAIK